MNDFLILFAMFSILRCTVLFDRGICEISLTVLSQVVVDIIIFAAGKMTFSAMVSGLPFWISLIHLQKYLIN